MQYQVNTILKISNKYILAEKTAMKINSNILPSKHSDSVWLQHLANSRILTCYLWKLSLLFCVIVFLRQEWTKFKSSWVIFLTISQLLLNRTVIYIFLGYFGISWEQMPSSATTQKGTSRGMHTRKILFGAEEYTVNLSKITVLAWKALQLKNKKASCTHLKQV